MLGMQRWAPELKGGEPGCREEERKPLRAEELRHSLAACRIRVPGRGRSNDGALAMDASL